MLKYLLLFVCFQSLLEADSYERPLSFGELIDIALENHPQTNKAWWNAKRAASLLGSSYSTYYPHIKLNTSLTQGRDFKFINGPDTDYTIISADLALSMMLYDFGERKALVNTAKMALLAAKWDVDLAMQKVIVNVLEKAYQLSYEEQALQAGLLSLKDAELMVSISEKLYHAGLNPISDLYISKSALSLMQIEIVKRKSLIQIQQGKLAAALGLPIQTCITLEPLPLPQNEAYKALCDLLLLAENQRADLMSKRAKTIESYALLNLAETAFNPKLSMKGKGGYEHAIKDKANGAHYEVVVNLDFPLFDGFKNVYNTKAAYANWQMSEEDLSELQLTAALEVLTFSQSVISGEEMLFYAEENLQNTHKAYTGTLDKYEIGEESIAELSNAQKQLAEARLLYQSIKTRLQVSIANLAYATGTL